MPTTAHTHAHAPAHASAPSQLRGVELIHEPLPAHAALHALLAQAELSPRDSAEVLQHLEPLISRYAQRCGYAAHDLIVLHPQTAGLDDLLSRFDKAHTHPDDEVRFILDGAGLFGFFDPDGVEQVVLAKPGDFVRVAAGVEHRFTLTESRRIKALRLFTDSKGWQARYTNRPVTPLRG